MPKVSKQDAKHDDYGPVESWHDEVDGHAIEFVTFKQDIDSTPLLKGLPERSVPLPSLGLRAERDGHLHRRWPRGGVQPR